MTDGRAGEGLRWTSIFHAQLEHGEARAALARRGTIVILVLLALLAVLPYGNALQNGFAFDDEPVIQRNPVVTDGVDLTRILASPVPPGDLYRPLTVLTFAVNERLSPGRAASFHAVNLLLHAAVTLLVFGIAVRLFASARVAAIAAALFAVHPIHTEAVTNIVGRAELLAALFGLLALVYAADADAAGPRQRRALQFASLASFSLAVLSKESALTVLPLILLLRVARRPASLWRNACDELTAFDWVPYALCAVVFIAVRSYVVGVTSAVTANPLDNVLAFVPWNIRIRTALGVLWDYFGLLNVPLVLAADYSYNQVPLVLSWLSPRCLGGLALVTVAGLAWGRQRQPALAFAAVFPLVAFAVTANLLFPIGTVKAERLLYLPSVGWVLVVAYGCEQLLRRSRYRALACGGLAITVACFAARTWTRNPDWADNLTLYRSMVRTAPDSAKARYNFGVALQAQRAHDAAIDQFHRGLSLYPWAEGAALGIGYSLHNRGFVDEAVPWYKKALQIAPELMAAHINLCSAYLTQGRLEAAAAACREGLRYAPTDATLLKGLGFSLVASGAIDNGIDLLQRSLALNENDDDLRGYVAQLQSDAAGLLCGVRTSQ